MRSATVVSDGCRDYIVALDAPLREGPGYGSVAGRVLADWRGRPRRFRSLAEAREGARRAGARHIHLAMRTAADEACAGEARTRSGFALLDLG